MADDYTAKERVWGGEGCTVPDWEDFRAGSRAPWAGWPAAGKNWAPHLENDPMADLVYLPRPRWRP